VCGNVPCVLLWVVLSVAGGDGEGSELICSGVSRGVKQFLLCEQWAVVQLRNRGAILLGE
jgi:hypothetical protein